ncbi:HAMP domain-containing sensor histidine kinase [Halomonas sp. I1]|uniref:sensor histidine kinase n=1 Tax=Halomonas sp. I1 TaxID=393536 RepID=UPI0028DEE875|nr:HAMP domain-containing sensor histidine kinase [Halomonas sp. I1]MDT8893169.1 HAMP domain-containing sensor histidine kinase [Halomonas sp. I1]
MTSLWHRLVSLGRSLYARIALVYLTGLLLLSAAVAWFATSQFDQLGRELQQRQEVGLADNLAGVMAPALRAGADSERARETARHIVSINPSLSLYVLDAGGRVIADYAEPTCGLGSRVAPASLEALLDDEPMLPVLADSPCSGQPGVFSVARIAYGPSETPGYLYADLNNASHTSMTAMLRTSSITRTLVAAGLLALGLSGLLGLLWFGLLTRRFSRLTSVVQRFADGEYQARIAEPRSDEIGQLGRAFNDMAGTIEAQLAALRETDRQRRELVANLSHDFRTPLTSLRGYVEQLQRREPLSDEERRVALTAIFDNAERLTRLARQLSTLARLDAYDHPLRREPFALAELAHDIAGKFQPQAERLGVTLSVDVDPALPWVDADLGLIDRALSNLIDNALIAASPEGRAWLEGEATEQGVRIRVSDDGEGIAAADLPLVTQRFYRTAASRARGEGSGLGLSIVREICERHGTTLDVDSREGKGTTVTLTLPRSRSIVTNV